MSPSSPRRFAFVLAGVGSFMFAAGCGSASTGSRGAASGAETTAAEIKAAPARCEPMPAAGRFELAVLGSGAPSDHSRASSGFVVIVDGHPKVLVDAGTRAIARMRELRLDFSAIDTILVTHLHRDHVDDLDDFLEMRVRGGAPVTVRVFGPAGAGRASGTRVFVDRVFGREGGLATKVGLANDLRVDAVDVPRLDRPGVIFRDAELAISAVSVDHGTEPALAYRIQRGNRSVVFSGDLASQDDAIIQLAQSADLLVYDTSVLDPPSLARQPSHQARQSDGKRGDLYALHTPPRRIGFVASHAPVGELLLAHLAPAVRLRQRELLDSIRTSFGGDVRLAEDCMAVKIGP